MGTDHLAVAVDVLDNTGPIGRDPVQFAIAHVLVDIAESLRVIAENAGAR